MRCRRAAAAYGAVVLLGAVAAPALATQYQGSGVGHPQPATPSPAQLVAARDFINSRAGHDAFAVVDSHGVLSGVHMHDRFHSASLVKAMLLVAYLQDQEASHSGIDSSLLYPMIHASDNGAASAVFGIVGQGGLSRVAHEVGMTDFSTSGAWGFTMISAADQARFFYVQDSLIPPKWDGYARFLLSTIEGDQSWCIPAAARPRFAVFFKGGWLPSEGLVNQAGRLERPGQTLSIAVLTDNGPGMGYGEDTIAGVTARLIG